MIHRSALMRIHENDAVLEWQRLQIGGQELRGGSQANSVNDQVLNQPNENLHAELRGLREESQALEMAIRENEPMSLESPRLDRVPPASEGLDLNAGALFFSAERFPSLESIKELEGAALKKSEMRHLTSAVRRFAREHDGIYPTELEQAVSYLRDNRRVPEFNLYELIFQGSNDELKGIPPSAVALIRERQAWESPQGNLARVYGMLGGNIEVVEVHDDFTAWEAQHVVPPMR